ncbi:class I SAM-dependent DNA methyltransferase [Deinococcus radiophilus]|uniref:site-specific DNA-methyltransferase (adenine-specific) n=2 Tax=Deinococcus radiophilus TaxID=32062 RepID=A0A3S0IGC0_9DEIO|nr:DNA methyltransferase [Deinococcus radiophilus]RTR21872.1 class I SAM-dependent DNA methyltransferase [Deinococcus radiophilus]UFA51940.1 class I SAM-dependent DNA methyltransferase [Deinococcus radiophilus]
MQTIRIHTNFTGTQKHVEEYDLDDLLSEQKRQRLRLLWTDPQAFNPAHTIELATVAAVESLARISDVLKAKGEDPEETAHFLIRVMFTLFAEDVGLLPEATFGRLLGAAKKHPEDFPEMCRELFGAMKVGRTTMQGRIPYINGGVFEATHAPALDLKAINLLHDASKRNWSQIDPTIFGTLFELVIDPGKRWQLGAHYTPLADILDVVEPVVFRPLREEWETVRSEIQPLLHDIEKNRAASGDLFTQQAATETLTGEVVGRLSAFQQRLAGVTVMDPAMGSGNFLYVTLRLLLDLELEVRETVRAVTLDLLPAPQVSPAQLLGMEVNPYAHEIAGMVLHIGYLQWMREHGEKREVSPVLRSLPGLTHCDAVMDGEEARPWPAAEFITGNPPFLGYSPMREQLGGGYVDRLRRAYAGKVPGQSDFVCYFFEQARENVEQGRTRRVGLIATNSISMGENARVLERITQTGSIFAAWPDRAWIQSGAAVRTAIVMFDGGEEQDRALLHHEGDERDPKRRVTVRTEVNTLHADLRSGPDLRSATALRSNAGRSFIGVIPGSKHFLLTKQDAQNIRNLPNPDGRDNSAVIRPFKVGKDVNGHDAERFIIDFSGLSAEEAAAYDQPMSIVRTLVKPQKDKMNRDINRRNWWRFNEERPGMRQAIKALSRFIVTSIVSEHRFFVFLGADVVPGNKLAVIASESYLDFGILNSRPHVLWAERKGSTHGVAGDLSYTPSTCFETFPFPDPDRAQAQAIEQAARHLEAMRAHLLSKRGGHGKPLTMTGIYNRLEAYRNTGTEEITGTAALARAHDTLDAAVAAAYGWPWPLGDAEVLEQLLAENLKRAQGRPTHES